MKARRSAIQLHRAVCGLSLLALACAGEGMSPNGQGGADGASGSNAAETGGGGSPSNGDGGTAEEGSGGGRAEESGGGPAVGGAGGSQDDSTGGGGANGTEGVEFGLLGYATGTGSVVRPDRRAHASDTTGVTGGEGEGPTVVELRTEGNELRDALRSGDYVGGMVFYVDDADYLAEILLENDRHHRNDDYGPPYAPITIYVTGTLTPTASTNQLRIERQANVSIIGDGDAGELDGIGIRIIDSSNIIIRNLAIHHVDVGEKTGIEVAYSNNVWIDHNELYSAGLFYDEDGSLDDSTKDYYDGLLDMKHGTNHVTVSWNVFRDHYKGLLLGHSDSPSAAPNNVTYHHNHFVRLSTRVPLIRYATTHMFNNVFEDIENSAINSREGALVRVERNYFDSVGSGIADGSTDHVQGPVGWWYGSSTGYWDVIDNVVVESATDHMQSTVTTEAPPYAYAEGMQGAEVARDLVLQYAGRSLQPAP